MTQPDLLTEAKPAKAAPSAVVKLTSADVKQQLAETYSEANGYACVFEVASGTGSNGGRFADAVVLNLWPSRGMELVGYEIKVSRQDWLNELKQPDKAWPVMRYCDRWFLLATPGVAKVDELPVNWGLIEFNGSKLTTRKAAPALTPDPLSRTFLGAMLRKPIRDIERTVTAAIAQRKSEMDEEVERRAKTMAERRVSKADGVLEKVEQIKAATGIDLLDWRVPDGVIQALKFALTAEPFSLFHGWNCALQNVESAAKDLQKLRDQLAAFLPAKDGK